MAGLVKTVALVYFFCLAHPRHGFAWNLPSTPPSQCGSTAPFCGDSSSAAVLKCCDVVAQSAPPDFHVAVQTSGVSSCADLTCQLCLAPSSGSASRLICAASLHHDDNEAKGMSTTAKIVIIALVVGVLIVVLGLTCFVNLKIIMKMVMNMILKNKNQQNINVNVDSGANAVATSAAGALALSNATAKATSKSDAQATLEQHWVYIKGKWQLLHGQWIVKLIDGKERPPSLPPTSTLVLEELD
ncbi:hypothetical protein EJB05_13804 [Eragrostis curvula]|uniref:Transmembrane protein n=1 Tax=Eragrostis curvula TaxID=38414 RepID=A0A5J9VXB6_9POAL|nr:hypothetical protein EJB05_13804 [Eragrostis curvula]